MGTSVSLGEHFEGLVKGPVDAGRYNNTSKVSRAGLLMIEARESHLATLDRALAESLNAEAEGRVTPIQDAGTRIKTKIRDAAGGRRDA